MLYAFNCALPKEQKRERETERGTEIKERENEAERGERERETRERHIGPICLFVSSTYLYPSQREYPKANLRIVGKVFHTSILCK